MKSKQKESFLALVVGSIGIVYGDIGTSPLYALKSCFTMGGVPVAPDAIIGLISLFIWCLLLIVSIKYVLLVLKMDHHGEGGVLALSSLVASLDNKTLGSIATMLGIIGVSLFFGDGIITPAISVLSAIEGISVAHPSLSSWIEPTTLLVLGLLFFVQHYGSGGIGKFFGPIMVLWFVVIAFLGGASILSSPGILKALNPYFAFKFLWSYSWHGIMSMAGVILVLTGAEALYADLGHFGRRPIQVSWNWIVFPALCLNYLGQGALLLKTPEAISHPFYHLAPSWALHGMIIFSTIATIIASQAVLSGLFSVVSQSTLLNYLPRMRIVNTSREHIGQVYAPALNFILFIFTTLAVLLFKNSENLAAAYGLCVAAIMLITSFLIFVMVSKKYTWSLVIRLIVFIPIFSIDMLFVITNAMKFKEGAWFAVLLSLGVFVIITTWVKGNKALQSQKINIHDPIKEFIEDHKKDYPTAIPGISLFLCRQPYKIPSALMMQLHHNKFLHEVVIFVSIVIKEKPVVKKTEHFEFETITNNCYQVVANYGFKENPNLYKVIEWLAHNKKIPNPQNVSIFLGRGIPVSSNYHNLSKFSQKLYILLASLSQNPTDFYKIPDQQVIELGLRYKL